MVQQSAQPERPRRVRAKAYTLAMLACAFASAAGGAESASPPAESGWVESFGSMAKRSLGNVQEVAEIRWRSFEEHMGFHKPRHIAAYRGYGNGDHVWVHGRVLHNRPYGGPKEDDGWWENLKATYQRWESDEVPGVGVTLEYARQRQQVTTDDEGYYSARFEVDENFPRADEVLARLEVDQTVLHAQHPIQLLPSGASYLVISDVDDTIIHTGLTRLLTAARLTFLHNARTRMPLLGVSALYRSLAYGESGEYSNPVIYVSNSAWNMYDLLRDFMQLNDVPAGPLLLRDIGLTADTDDHKIETIGKLMTRYAPLPTILIGDSGQHDAEIYAEIARQFPERVHSIFIRDVNPGEDSEHDGKVDDIIAANRDLDIHFKRIEDSGQIAADLASAGLIPAAAVERVRESVRTDRRRAAPDDGVAP